MEITVKLAAVELHADCGLVVPVDRVEPDEPSNNRREEGVSLCIIGLLVPNEYLVKVQTQTWSEELITCFSLAVQTDGSNITHLPQVPAVAFIEDPPPPVGAVRDRVLDHKLGLEHLLGSLCGHLADHNWPLEVHLVKPTGSGLPVQQTSAHMQLLHLQHIPESSCCSPLRSMHCIYPDYSVWQGGAPSILQTWKYCLVTCCLQSFC